MVLRIRNAPAVIEWSDMSSTPRSSRYLAEPHPQSVQLSLHFDQHQQFASFKIRVLLNARKETAGKDGDYLHILVHPSDVILLLQDPAHRLPDGVSAVLHGPTTCLRLVLSKPVSIAAPSDISRPQKGRNSRLLSSLRMLAEQTVLTIHFGQHHVPNPGAIQQLCQAFSDGSVKQHPRHNTLQDFYPGRGAIVIEDFGNFAGFGRRTPALGCNNPDDAQNTKSPPPYAEAQPTTQPVPHAPGARPPPSLFAQPPRKRPRASTSTSTAEPPDTRNFYSEFLAQQKAQTEAFLSQQAQMGKMLAHLGNQVEQMPDRVVKLVSDCLSEKMAKVKGEELGKWEDAIKTILQQEVDVAVETSLERQSEEFIDHVKTACREDLEDELEDASVTIRLSRYR